MVRTAIAEFGDQVAVGLDVRGPTLAAAAGRRRRRPVGGARPARPEGCARYVVTDVTKDGTLAARTSTCSQGRASDRPPVVASGGVSTLDDLARSPRSTRRGVEGAIVGKALYAGRSPCRRRWQRWASNTRWHSARPTCTGLVREAAAILDEAAVPFVAGHGADSAVQKKGNDFATEVDLAIERQVVQRTGVRHRYRCARRGVRRRLSLFPVNRKDMSCPIGRVARSDRDRAQHGNAPVQAQHEHCSRCNARERG